MNSQASDDFRQQSNHRLPLALAVGGLLIIVGSVIAGLDFKRPLHPGRLVPRQDALTWESPIEKSFRTLAVNEASAKFEVENVGGTSVRILQVETTCGCTVPQVHPTIVEPGRSAVVDVQATPLQIGEKTVRITLKTDAQASPEIALHLRIIGRRPPPFMAQAGGDLSYVEDSPTQEIRKIIANNIEFEDSDPKPPIIRTEMSILKIGPPVLMENKPYIVPGSVHRKYIYEVRLLSKPGPENSSGEVFIVDPWDPQHVERISVHLNSPPPLRVIPSHIILRARKGHNDKESSAKILVLSTTPLTDCLVEVEGNRETPLVVGPVMPVEDDRRVTFSLALKPGTTQQGEYSVIVHRASAPDRLSVPVAVQVEDVR